MNFGILGFGAWYNIAYLRIGGVLEMTAPFGIVIALYLFWLALWLVWRGISALRSRPGEGNDG